jgi:hypothetical protein
VAISCAPLARAQAYKKQMGWRFKWVSYASDVNSDYHVSFTKDQLKDDGDTVFHTYSAYTRGDERGLGTYTFLDLTPKGRSETGPSYNLTDWVKRHNEYDTNNHVRISMWIGNHLDSSFEIWKGGHTWFWFVADACCSGAAIGAAANQAEAIREACLSIEEMAARRSGSPDASGISNSTVRATQRRRRFSSTDPGWNDLLTNLERYLTRLSSQCV